MQLSEQEIFRRQSLDELYNVAHTDVMALVQEAKRLGMFEPTFPMEVA